MTLVRTSPSGPNVDVGGGGGDVSSVFGRTGDVTAENGDYSATQVANTSDVEGDNVAEALDSLDDTISGLNSGNIFNISNVPGERVSDALDSLATDIAALDSSDIANVSTVTGATVTDALDTLFGSASGRLLGSASRRTAGSETINCPAGTRKILVRMTAGGGGGGFALFGAGPVQSAAGGGGSGAEQEFLYTAGSDIASISVVCGASGNGSTGTGGGNGGNTTVTINGELFTSVAGEGAGDASTAGSIGRPGLPGQNNFQTGSNFVLLKSSGGNAGTLGNFDGSTAGGSLARGGNGGSNSWGGGGFGGHVSTSAAGTGQPATGNGAGGGGGGTDTVSRNGGAGSPGGVSALFFT